METELESMIERLQEEETELEDSIPEPEEQKAPIVDRLKEIIKETKPEVVEEPVIPLTEVVQRKGVIKFSAKELNIAAEKILAVIQDYAADGLHDMAENQACIPLWQYVSGVLFSAYNEGRMAVYDLDPAWGEEGFGDVYTNCEVCLNEFKPKAMGQKVCGQECGIVLAKRTRDSEAA